MRRILLTTATAAALALPASMAGAVTYGDVNPGIIMGTGITNGSFTIDRDNPFGEVALRAKLRYDDNGDPQNIFNHQGNGNYLMPSGSPTAGSQTARWNFEFSINSDYPDGPPVDYNLGAATYELGLDGDPTAGTNFLTFDLIHDGTYFDHAISSNFPDADGVHVAGDGATYDDLISSYNVAQNSWNYSFFLTDQLAGFDPNASGQYTIYLKGFDGNGDLVANSEINVFVGDSRPSPVPLPASALLLLSAFGGLGALSFSRKRSARAA